MQQEADKKAAKAAVKRTGVQARDKMRELLADSLAVALPDVVNGVPFFSVMRARSKLFLGRVV